MVAEPPEAPVTMPVVPPTVATPVLPLVHVPPTVASARVVVVPAQIDTAVEGVIAAGAAFTVMEAKTEQVPAV